MLELFMLSAYEPAHSAADLSGDFQNCFTRYFFVFIFPISMNIRENG